MNDRGFDGFKTMSNQTQAEQDFQMADLGPALISVRQLNVHYGTVPALDCPELHVPQGAIVTVIGANGRSEERRVGKSVAHGGGRMMRRRAVAVRMSGDA